MNNEERNPVMSEKSIFKKKSFYVILILLLAVLVYSIYVKIMDNRYEAQQEDVGNVKVVEAAEDLGRENTYAIYMEEHMEAKSPNHEVVIDLFDYSDAEKVEIHDSYEEGKSTGHL